jgi:hypothetical protein
MEIQIMAIISSLLIRVTVLALPTLPITAFGGEIRCPQLHEGARLTTVTLFDGLPSEHADLMPDTFRKSKSGSRSEWEVAYIFKAGRRLYVECQYGPKVSTVILEPEPATDKCEWLSQANKNVSFVCK